MRGKLMPAPLAVMLLAGAFSSLPSTVTWPLHHGYGGMLGDLGLGLLASLLLPINADWAGLRPACFCFAGGVSCSA